ncbi:fumarylacetoacetate hydrolase domain-containing protein 1-like protein [Camelus ferus]|nr:fumarylacetoacetate hydrolase domain-containing protein 1-like protein [Camelus ferus]
MHVEWSHGTAGRSHGCHQAAVPLLGVGEEHRVGGQELCGSSQGDAERGAERAIALPEAVLAYAPEGSLVLMPACSRNLHRELELGVLMSRRGRAVLEATAMAYVAGYALCLDMTARDVQDECKKKGLPWTLAKSFTASCLVSALVPKEKFPDPHNLKLWLKVNDELRQDGEASSMIFSIPYLISYVSKIMTLEEGDISLTGTRKGVGSVKTMRSRLAYTGSSV